MIMIPYSSEEAPPAPFMDAEIRNPILGISERMRAKLDTGAAMVTIPSELVERLRLLPAGERTFRGYNGQATVRKTYFVNIDLNGYKFEMAKVTSAPRDNILIGRNILNQLEIHLDGKNSAFEVRDP